MAADDELTILFQRIRQGEAGAREELFRRVYDELRDMAAQRMRRERPDHTWQPTALVHEVYGQLVQVAQCAADRRYFFAAASQAMWRALVDHARQKKALAHGGRHARVPWDEAVEQVEAAARVDLLVLNEALEQLQARFPKPHEALLRQIFGGQQIEEIAADMDVAADTVNKYLAFAKAWLRSHLDERT